ncbi:hypothetical protein BGX38DRAFT_1150217 [Terfezia claveryi]|nr:hypothetical protein BGX38DRAFT_1150217 [Terfezia claveryi]
MKGDRLRTKKQLPSFFPFHYLSTYWCQCIWSTMSYLIHLLFRHLALTLVTYSIRSMSVLIGTHHK